MPNDTLDSLLGSSKIANAFNLANKVYEVQVDPAAYIDASLVLALP
jgi:hypothetical protein